MQTSPNRLRGADEGHKQLYWGSFVLGSAAFHEHRRNGFLLDGMAVEELALRKFRELRAADDSTSLLFVEDWSSGLVCFTQGFAAGYRQRAERLGQEGLTLRHDLEATSGH